MIIPEPYIEPQKYKFTFNNKSIFIDTPGIFSDDKGNLINESDDFYEVMWYNIENSKKFTHKEMDEICLISIEEFKKLFIKL